jgi:hypothetical protein
MLLHLWLESKLGFEVPGLLGPVRSVGCYIAIDVSEKSQSLGNMVAVED